MKMKSGGLMRMLLSRRAARLVGGRNWAGAEYLPIPWRVNRADGYDVIAQAPSRH
jgi:hypothetical protein